MDIQQIVVALASVSLLCIFTDFALVIGAYFSPVIKPGKKQYNSYAVLVPIYGNIKYLTNTQHLKKYKKHIVLVTTSSESPEFYADLEKVKADFGFRILKIDVERHSEDGGTGARSTSVPIRDQIMRGAIETVKDEYVICIDADTLPLDDFGRLAGYLKQNNVDLASLYLLPGGSGIWWALQRLEYQLSMAMRRIWPWMLSGGCHAARTECYKDIMRSHSMYFQGNDVETGILGRYGKYNIKNVGFRAQTDVPAKAKDWWRQRFAWSGGEFRIGIVNITKLTPLFILYFSFFVIMLLPLRWWILIQDPALLIIVIVVYWILTAITIGLYRKELALGKWWLIVIIYPLYGLISSLFLIGLGPYSYVKMSREHKNWGIIKTKKITQEAQERQLELKVEQTIG